MALARISPCQGGNKKPLIIDCFFKHFFLYDVEGTIESDFAVCCNVHGRCSLSWGCVSYFLCGVLSSYAGLLEDGVEYSTVRKENQKGEQKKSNEKEQTFKRKVKQNNFSRNKLQDRRGKNSSQVIYSLRRARDIVPHQIPTRRKYSTATLSRGSREERRRNRT